MRKSSKVMQRWKQNENNEYKVKSSKVKGTREEYNPEIIDLDEEKQDD